MTDCEHVWDQRGEGWFCVVCHRFTLMQPSATDISFDKSAFDIMSAVQAVEKRDEPIQQAFKDAVDRLTKERERNTDT